MKSLKLKKSYQKRPPLMRQLKVEMLLEEKRKLEKRQVRENKAGKLRLVPSNYLAMNGLCVKISLSVITPNTSTLLLANASEENTVLSQGAKQEQISIQQRTVHVSLLV